MSEMTQRLRKWADALDSETFTQAFTTLGHSFSNVCAIGCGVVTLHGWKADGTPNGTSHVSSAIGEDICGRDAHAWRHCYDTEEDILDELRRITGLSAGSIVSFNDGHGTDFPTFARAIRTVARKIEEQEAGEPIAVSETVGEAALA